MLVGFRPSSVVAQSVQTDAIPVAQQLEATHNDIPSWETLGLEDLLTVPTQSTVTAPQNGSVHTGSAHHRILDNIVAALPTPVGRHLRPQPLRPYRTSDYYLYFLYRLRL